jgi:hypothetical protein
MRLRRHVSNQPSHHQANRTIFKVYKVTVHIWNPEDLDQQVLVGKGKVHPCTGTEALYRPYGP